MKKIVRLCMIVQLLCVSLIGWCKSTAQFDVSPHIYHNRMIPTHKLITLCITHLCVSLELGKNCYCGITLRSPKRFS